MTPKEKAKELIQKYNELPEECSCYEYMCICFRMGDYYAKKCALIAVEEILNNKSFLISITLQDINYWQEVKQEIEKL